MRVEWNVFELQNHGVPIDARDHAERHRCVFHDTRARDAPEIAVRRSDKRCVKDELNYAFWIDSP